MRERKRTPGHPGGILRRLYMEPLGISVSDLTETIQVPEGTISGIIAEEATIFPDVALRLSKAFGTTPDLWMNLQKNYDLWQAMQKSSDWQKVKAIHSCETQVMP